MTRRTLFIFCLVGKQYCGKKSLSFTRAGQLRAVIPKLKSLGINIFSIVIVVTEFEVFVFKENTSITIENFDFSHFKQDLSQRETGKYTENKR